MMKTTLRSLTLAGLMATVGGCNPLALDEVQDPNNPTVGGVLQGASRAELQNLLTGLEARQRETITGAIAMFGSYGRELWFIQTDARSITDVLGQGMEAYPDLWGSGVTYQTPYGAIKQANVLIQAVENTDAVTPAERSAYTGFARTTQGLQYLTPLNAQYENGIRIDVADPLNPGPFLGYAAALAAIRAKLDEGAANLAAAGSTLPFNLTAGFDGFKTPAGLRQINRAIAARAAIYAKDWQGALAALQESFFSLTGDLNAGPKLIFGSPPDVFNPLYFPLHTTALPLIGVHPRVIEDALPGDRRIAAKFAARTTPYVNPRLKAAVTHQPILWANASTPVPIIRNEELVLMYAEAQAQLGNGTAAVSAIDRIRSAAGLPAYGGARTSAALIDEILLQRRYSLWGEGHRWIDLRRYGRLNEISVAEDAGTVFRQLARPLSETRWEESRPGGR
jgi:starch-binding outer membrane protein, SusD/RagB family